MKGDAMAEKHYSVHELAELSGVSVRTLHHYDAIGLLSPGRSENNYRVYTRAEINRLQQILFFREAGMGLAAIQTVLDSTSFDAMQALEEHRNRLIEQRGRTNHLIETVEKTLKTVKGKTTMSDKEKFEGFKRKLVEDNEKKYGAEVRAAYGDEVIDASNAKVMGMTEESYQASQDLEARMREALLAGMETGDPSGAEAQQAADLHRQWLGGFWKEGMYSKEAHKGLAEMYVADERFKHYYDKTAPGMAEFLRDAIVIYCS